MPAAGQAAIVAAAAAGTGVVFTEYASVEVREGRYAQLAPLVLLGTNRSVAAPLSFTLTSSGHPIWTGLPTGFTTTKPMGFSEGGPLNGGVSIAIFSDAEAAVVVREGTGGAGRVVHLDHAAAVTPGWGDDAHMMLLFTNAVRWAAHCL
jgi:hypothetical protein